jgi:deoxyribonucleoside regulator
MDINDSRKAILAHVASLYFDQNKTQQEIADNTGIARTMVSRMIAEARERGVVEIKVHFPWTSKGMENDLTEKFGLQAARVMVMDDGSQNEVLIGLGVVCAEYFNSIIHDNMTIGISWGSAIQRMIDQLKPRKMNGVEIVQLIGATGLESNLSDGPLLAQLLTNRLGATCRYLHAPLVVENKMIRDGLLQERSIKDTLLRAGEADIAIVGIGSIDPDIYSLKIAGYISEEERQQLADAGVVGDFCGHHYSVTGEILDISINDRVIGIDKPTLAKIGSVVAVAGGKHKEEAILGALRGKFVDVLITDAETAQYLLDHA